jgi:imidazole glycerol phosphate synthase glutamine amidotransferase subunit
MREVMLVDTGLANLRSVQVALERQGATVRRVGGPGDVAGTQHLVLPGVGAFGPAMRKLHNDGLVLPLRQRLLAGRPTLAVCLGLQLMCADSAEEPGVLGLNVLPAQVSALPAGSRVPNMGWLPLARQANAESADAGSEHAYFAHSFAVTESGIGRLESSGWQVLTATHGVPYVAAVKKGAVVGCQFHPELSGRWGEQLLQNWLATERGKETPWPA